MKKNLILPSIIAVVSFTACKKETIQPQPQTAPAPTITINQPTSDHYHVGETLTIDVVVTDEKEMHEVNCWLIALPQNDTIWSQKKHAHTASITVVANYTIGNFADDQQIDLVVVGENASGKETTATHSIHIHDH